MTPTPTNNAYYDAENVRVSCIRVLSYTLYPQTAVSWTVYFSLSLSRVFFFL